MEVIMKKSLLLSVVTIGSLQAMQADPAGESNTARTQRPRRGLTADRYASNSNASSDSEAAQHTRLVLTESEPSAHHSDLRSVYMSSAAQFDHNHEPIFTFKPIKSTLTKRTFRGQFPGAIDLIIKNLNQNQKTGFLALFGPPGTGKSTLAELIAGETGRDFYAFTGAQLGGCFKNHGGKKLDCLFEGIREAGRPAIVFIDEVSGIANTHKHSDTAEDDNFLCALRDKIIACKKDKTNLVYIIIATHDDKKLEAAFLSRFRWKITLELPDQDERTAIFERQLALSDNKLDNEFVRSAPERTYLAERLALLTNTFSRRELMDALETAQDLANQNATEDDPNSNMILETHLAQSIAYIISERMARKETFFQKHCTLENGFKLATLAISLYGIYQWHKQHNLSIEQFRLSIRSLLLGEKQLELAVLSLENQVKGLAVSEQNLEFAKQSAKVALETFELTKKLVPAQINEMLAGGKLKNAAVSGATQVGSYIASAGLVELAKKVGPKVLEAAASRCSIM